ncbi:MAG: SDR family NAD(P)-dependent oxidoreductase [Inquilinaceae bacterium]
MTGTESSPSAPLTGRRAVITGGAQGLGRAIASRLADAGAEITIVDLEAGFAGAGLPSGWETFAADLTAPDAEARLGDLAARLDVVDILVANAGVVPPWRGIADLDRAEWDAVFAVNVWGAAVAMKSISGSLARSDAGSIVLMASINGYRAHPQQALYTASKHAVIGLMRAAAQDLGRHGIRVNALAPGPVATDALLGRLEARHHAGGPAPDDAITALARETALNRIATPGMVADAALFLASDLSAGITGSVLPVECGLT